ncbi:MAG: Fic family protein [Bacteroidetes bacterium]|nr:Fic family protein [Bacteroidota bacterium]
MKVTDKKYLSEFSGAIGTDISKLINNYDFSESQGGFEYLTKASAVYSSNIEGNSIDLNSYMNYELSNEKFKKGKEIEEIENLVSAYSFAQNSNLDEKHLLRSHEILSETLLIKSKRGKYRTEKVGVFGKTGIAYLAIEAEFIHKEMKVLFQDIKELLGSDFSEEETFYYASLIHLIFVHIHPFRDGNGRAARLLEKWFLAEKLGRDFWKIPSEKYYKEHQKDYYRNINLGVNFYELNYDRCGDFLKMLPNSLK